jgi:hypothetical protein
MKLYKISRIKEIENSDRFLIDFQKSQLRKKSSIKMVRNKKDILISKILSLDISVEIIRRNNLIKLVMDVYNERNYYKGYSNISDINDATMGRFMVNYIRHTLTSYDEFLDDTFSKVGKDEAYRLLNERIYKSIGNAYPYLTKECELQMVRKFC